MGGGWADGRRGEGGVKIKGTPRLGLHPYIQNSEKYPASLRILQTARTTVRSA